MKNLFKDNLQQLRGQKTISPFFSTCWNYKVFKQLAQTSEKTEVLKSLEAFAQESISDSPLELGEAELIIKKDQEINYNLLKSEQEYSELVNLNFSGLLQDYFARFKQSGIKIVFVTDEYENDSDNTGLALFFNEQVEILFERMVTAMGVTSSEYVIFAFDDQTDEKIYHSLLAYWNPQIIITLGATATKKILGKEERLKNIHGQIEDISLVSDSKKLSLKAMPLFSPKLLISAPNMKKIAWEDMQKAMKIIN